MLWVEDTWEPSSLGLVQVGLRQPLSVIPGRQGTYTNPHI